MLKLFTFEDGAILEMATSDDTLAQALLDAHWVDAQAPQTEERHLLQHCSQVALPELSEMAEIEASARYFVDHAGIHVHSLFLTQSDGRHMTCSVACILQPHRLITIRDCELADFRLLRMRARRGQVESHSAAELLVTLLEQKVENLADNLEDIHRRLEQISYMVLEEEDSDLEQAIAQLARSEDSNGKIRLCLMDTQRAISFLLRHLRDAPPLQDACREIMRDIETLMSHTTFLFDKINFLMDSTQGFINIEQNQIIKIFSIAAVVFLPPTLVASIYGMNFAHMPELQWLLGYPWALGLMLVSGITPYLFFKYKGWL